MFFRGPVLFTFFVIFNSGLAQEQCRSLVDASYQYPQCVSLGNCTGMTCTATISGEPVETTFVVDKCTDPVSVNVIVESGGGNVSFSRHAVGLQTFTEGNLTFAFSITRCDDNLKVQASMDTNEIIPQISVPLNQTYCMCKTIEGAVYHTCKLNKQCSGVSCEEETFSKLIFEVDIQPCEIPPAILVIVKDSNFQPVYEKYFTKNNTGVSIPHDDVSVVMNIFITHNDYSMNIEVNIPITVSGQTKLFSIVGPAQIIIDKHQCSSTIAPLPQYFPPEYVSNTTCSIITDLATHSQDSSSVVLCVMRTYCDGMKCIWNEYYTVDVQLLGCSDPARFYVEITRIGTTVFSESLSQSIIVDLQAYGQLMIVIDDYGDQTSIEVYLDTGFGNASAVYPLLRIPKDYCDCPNITCTSTSDIVIAGTVPSLLAVIVSILFILVCCFQSKLKRCWLKFKERNAEQELGYRM